MEIGGVALLALTVLAGVDVAPPSKGYCAASSTGCLLRQFSAPIDLGLICGDTCNELGASLQSQMEHARSDNTRRVHRLECVVAGPIGTPVKLELFAPISENCPAFLPPKTLKQLLALQNGTSSTRRTRNKIKPVF